MQEETGFNRLHMGGTEMTWQSCIIMTIIAEPELVASKQAYFMHYIAHILFGLSQLDIVMTGIRL